MDKIMYCTCGTYKIFTIYRYSSCTLRLNISLRFRKNIEIILNKHTSTQSNDFVDFPALFKFNERKINPFDMCSVTQTKTIASEICIKINDDKSRGAGNSAHENFKNVKCLVAYQKAHKHKLPPVIPVNEIRFMCRVPNTGSQYFEALF